jgi:GTP-binding protein EngB required for normal cell division
MSSDVSSSFPVHYTSPALSGSFNLIEPLLTRFKEICNQFQIITLNRQIEACENLFRQGNMIDVAILGQFKAGKSSFLNSLISKKILPVGVIPVTTVITRLQYGRKERAIITHFDGQQTEVDPSSIEEFISEAKNPANQKNVETVDVELSSLERFAGLRLVDTPGLGSILKYHADVLENWLPDVGTALLTVSADRPLSENDLQLIRDLRKHTPKIVLLLTKADLLTPEQQKEVVLFFRTALKRELREELPLFLYSTRTETEELKQKLETEILQPLSTNREEEFKNIVQHKVKSIRTGILSYLEIALKTSLHADSDREQLKKKILDEKVNYQLIREELSLIATDNAQQTRELIKNYLEKFQEPYLQKKLVEMLRHEMPSWRGNLSKLTRTYEDWLQGALSKELDHISKNEHKHFLGTLKKAHASFSRSLEAFRSLLNQNIERVLGLRLAEAEWKIEVEEPHQPDIKISRIFDFHLDLIWFLIPMTIFRRLFEKHFFNQIPYAAMVNLSRLAAQWEDRINKVIHQMKEQALKYVHDELATIEALLLKAGGRTEEIRQAMDELREEMEALAG